ncbi:DUF5709 domain-containing protein [Streptomyces sp. NBC_01340]|uniref:DUF5709 domain-containing protein n=1 Tax=unclassified Streptomyces TaxID=2593676 RepID=UPI002257575B|nr:MULTISPECIES: DUF5709 domain-containing protein [unclassified Streptomyces]MCX4461923.1 DUF5709 domain-containing protein [Streptomyces sp. NBC_01719]MCX4490831.1 DUF5709 domain-containing protein [Streptomyces sp. NBC_01728]MCX4594588.1 DUF5709 domain-containing protein [Streptomyces sp. NBC_01549]WSI36173.1 DUF5709 domain-containing protein [Streptomyces sp. NBC_01340]
MAYEAMGDEVYQPDGSEVQDDAGLLDVSDTLDDRGVDEALDEGYSPPERPWGVEHTGVTAAERQRGESLDERLAEEIPDVAVQVGDDIGDLWDGDGELIDDEVGDRRAGRLIAPDEGAHEDTEKDLIAYDAGVDGAGASAEEAAIHVIPDSESF